jgi:DNA-binding NarL/FixJ family response regulator
MTEDRRILIADDHAPTRRDVREALEAGGFEVCAEVATAGAAVEAAGSESPDICLLDIRMPGGGIWATAQIADKVPDTSIVMLTVSRDEADIFEALKAGAVGYLLKDIDPEQLPRALTAVLNGEAAIPRWIVGRLVDELRRKPGRRLRIRGSRVTLTARESEILDLLLEGLTTAEIAERLFVAQVTVRSHIATLLRKLDVPDRAAARRLFEVR